MREHNTRLLNNTECEDSSQFSQKEMNQYLCSKGLKQHMPAAVEKNTRECVQNPGF